MFFSSKHGNAVDLSDASERNRGFLWGGGGTRASRSSHGGIAGEMKDDSHKGGNVRRGSRSLLLSGDLDLATLLIESFGAKQEVHAVNVTESLLHQVTEDEAVRLVEAIAHFPYLDTFEITFPEDGIVSVAQAVVALMADAAKLHSLTITNMDMDVYTQQFISASQGHPKLKHINVKACEIKDTAVGVKEKYGFTHNQPRKTEGVYRAAMKDSSEAKREYGSRDSIAQTLQQQRQHRRDRSRDPPRRRGRSRDASRRGGDGERSNSRSNSPNRKSPNGRKSPNRDQQEEREQSPLALLRQTPRAKSLEEANQPSKYNFNAKWSLDQENNNNLEEGFHASFSETTSLRPRRGGSNRENDEKLSDISGDVSSRGRERKEQTPRHNRRRRGSLGGGGERERRQNGTRSSVARDSNNTPHGGRNSVMAAPTPHANHRATRIASRNSQALTALDWKRQRSQRIMDLGAPS